MGIPDSTAIMDTIFTISSDVLAQTDSQSNMPLPRVRLISPRAGDSFIPGQKVNIVWQVDVPPNIDARSCEQEIFLSLDGGKTISYRLTPELNPTVRQYQWTVPNLPTERVVLDIRFGSELDTARFEKSQPQKNLSFA
jgi:hypothetical protein